MLVVILGSDFSKLCSVLTNPTNFCKSDYNVGTIIYEFDKFIAANPTIQSPEMDWITDIV